MSKINDQIGWKTTWQIQKFLDPHDEISAALKHGLSIVEALSKYKASFLGTENWVSNVALNEGLGELIDLAFGLGTPTAFDGTTGYLGVGDSATAADPTDTGLIAATNKTYVVFDDNYPARTNQTVEARATFGSAVGNHGWQEFTVANGADNTAKNLNRKVADKGTKVSGETWVALVSLVFS